MLVKKHPMKCRLKTLPVEYVHARVSMKRPVEIYTGIFTNRKKFLIFKQNSSCVECGIQGAFYAIEKDNMDANCVNLYAIDDHGDEVLMTLDHIIPAIKGGSSDPSNLRTMCKLCNELRGCDEPWINMVDTFIFSYKPTRFGSCSL